MTLERFIGYSGLFLVIIHAIPFADSFVTIATILIGVGLILSATYLRWRNKINRFVSSQYGTITIPHLFNKLEHHGQQMRNDKKLNNG
jgi:hypothetical protein